MSAAWIAGVSIPAVYLLSAVCTPLMLWWERRRPSAYSRRPEVLAAWRAMSAAEQEAYDNARLDAGEAAEVAAARIAEAAERNALFRP